MDHLDDIAQTLDSAITELLLIGDLVQAGEKDGEALYELTPKGAMRCDEETDRKRRW